MYDNVYAQNCSIARLLLFLTIGLLSFGITNNTWFSLEINLTDCTQCGRIIVTVGDAFEKMLVNTNFTMQDYVHIDAGIWSASVCTVDRLCLDMKLCEAETLFGFQAMFTRIFGKLIFAKAGLNLFKCSPNYDTRSSMQSAYE